LTIKHGEENFHQFLTLSRTIQPGVEIRAKKETKELNINLHTDLLPRCNGAHVENNYLITLICDYEGAGSQSISHPFEIVPVFNQRSSV